MLLLVASALAAAPYVQPSPFAVEAGLDAGWLVGGNGGGYRAGFGERLAFAMTVSTASALLVEVGHDHHVVVDGRPWLPDTDAAEDVLSGGRDTVTLAGGVRVGFDRVDERALPADHARVYPYARFLGGFARCRTTLLAPGFDGPAVLPSTALLPRLLVGIGAEVRLRRWLSVSPHVDGALVLAEDVGEVDGESSWGIEARIAPTVDVRVGF